LLRAQKLSTNVKRRKNIKILKRVKNFVLIVRQNN